jgi:pimeloyl-ACP methyl ester carboxylesterase
MKKHWIRKFIKIIGWVLLVLVIVLSYLLYRFTSPNTDDDIIEKFEGETYQPHISYENFKDNKVRVIQMQKEIDKKLPIIFFVHGSPGSSMDFQRYMKSEALNKAANIISYDRVGYGQFNTGEVLNSLEDELALMHQLLKGMDIKKVVLVGYSYGGTLIMASNKDYKKKVALAAAVRGDLEPMFWVINLYKWPLTRPLVPNVFKGATLEKIRHLTELKAYKNKWNISPSQVLSIHGKEDFIVPIENSIFLDSLFNGDKFSLITLENGNHSLIWSNFDLIETELLKSVKE